MLIKGFAKAVRGPLKHSVISMRVLSWEGSMGAKFKSFSIFVLLTLAVTSLFIPQAAASTVPVQLYGPEQFTRDPGSPQTVSRDFSVQRLVAQSYTMQVQNGSMEGDSQVSSAVVTLNGNVILKQNDFNQNVYYLEKPVVVLKRTF